MQQIREAIEGLDRELLELLGKRMALVEEIVEAKLQAAFPFRDQLREEAVLARVRAIAVELGLDSHEVERFYRHIMEMSIAHQQAHIHKRSETPLRVTYQGVEGSYTHLTAQRRYAGRPGGVLLTGCTTFRDAVEAVLSGKSDVALLPIENTTAGSINDTYDLLGEGGITITAEVVSKIEHCLLVLPGTRLEDLRVVISHPQALMQCEALWRKAPWIRPVAEFDTAGAARKVKAGNDPTVGAIASASAAALLGLEVLEKGVQTQAGNFTRFVEVAREAVTCPPDTPCKTSLLVQLDHKPGALGELLGVFGRCGVNLTKLESRPVLGSAWTYRFYLDVAGHAASRGVGEALEGARELVVDLRVLGTDPRSGG